MIGLGDIPIGWRTTIVRCSTCDAVGEISQQELDALLVTGDDQVCRFCRLLLEDGAR